MGCSGGSLCEGSEADEVNEFGSVEFADGLHLKCREEGFGDKAMGATHFQGRDSVRGAGV